MNNSVCEILVDNDIDIDWYPMQLVKEDKPYLVAKYVNENKPFFDTRYSRLSKQAKTVQEVMLRSTYIICEVKGNQVSNTQLKARRTKYGIEILRNINNVDACNSE